MTKEQLEELRGLISEVEMKCLIYGRACERHDLNDEYSRFPALKKYRTNKHQAWTEASNKLHVFLNGLVK
ncbi:hypothetical protein CPTPhageEI1_239 [Klebsiella phage EI]|nr:hypothetical protein CPTPhageEI1_239 [Klebsiella phage EI]